ncbi:Uncharacterised protein [Achromobacter xylosoxidans]|nr:Uncharacterised protein [Achromobacter xylosoxidans]
MSGLGSNSICGAPPPSLVFFSFWLLTFFTRQSATAATAMKMSTSAALAITASCIWRAVMTDSAVTPRGTGRAVAPVISVTRAPASRAARARA